MADTGLNIKLAIKDDAVKKELRSLETQAKASDKTFRAFQKQIEHLEGADKLEAMNKALSSLTDEFNATSEKAKLLKKALDEVANNSKLGKDSAQYKDLSNELAVTENKATILKSQMSELKAEMLGAGSSAEKTSSDFDKMGNSMKDASDSTSGLGNTASVAIGNLAANAVSKLADVAIDAAKAMVEVGSNFEAAMSEVEAISGASSSDLDQMSQKAKELGSNTKFSATEVAEGFKYMSLAGWDTEQALSAIDGVVNLAAASEMDLGQASDMVTDYLSAFGLAASDAGKMVDEMVYAQSHSNTSTAQLGEAFGNCAANMNAAGQSMETTTAILEAMANQGTKGSEAGTELSSVMSDITKKMKDGKIQIGDTSVAVADSKGNFRDLTDILKDVETATQGMGDAEKAQALQATFQKRSIVAVNEVLNEGVDKVKGYKDALEDSEGAAERASETMMDNFKGAVTEAGSAAEGLGVAVFEKLSKPLTAIVDFAGDAMSALTDVLTPPPKSDLENYLDELEERIKQTKEEIESIGNLEISANADVAEIEAYRSVLEKATTEEKLSEFEKYQLKVAVEKLGDKIPGLTEAYDEEASKINMVKTELQDLLDVSEQQIKQNAYQEALEKTYKKQADALVEVAQAQSGVETAVQNLKNSLTEENEGILDGLFNEEELGDYKKVLDDILELKRKVSDDEWRLKVNSSIEDFIADLILAQQNLESATNGQKLAEEQVENTVSALEKLVAEEEKQNEELEITDKNRGRVNGGIVEESVAVNHLLNLKEKEKKAQDDLNSSNIQYLSLLKFLTNAEEDFQKKLKEVIAQKLSYDFNNIEEQKKVHDVYQEQLQDLKDVKQGYEDYIETIEKAWKYDPSKAYNPITADDENYVSFEQKNQNLTDYINHTQERMELLNEWLPKLADSAPDYVQQFYEKMAEGDEEGLQSLYENLRNTLDKQGPEILQEYAEKQQELLDQMDEINHDLAVQAAMHTYENAEKTLSGRMTNDDKEYYNQQIESIKTVHLVTDKEAEALKQSISTIQALGIDLSDTMKNYLGDSTAWSEGANNFKGFVDLYKSEVKYAVGEIKKNAEELGVALSESQEDALIEAISNQDPKAIESLLQDIYSTAGIVVDVDAEGKVQLTADTSNVEDDTTKVIEETKKRAQEIVDGSDAIEVISAMQVRTEPDKNNKDAEIPSETSTDQTINVNATQKVELTNKGEVEKVVREDAKENEPVTIMKQARVVQIANVLNKNAVDSEMSNVDGGEGSTKTVTRTVNIKTTTNASGQGLQASNLYINSFVKGINSGRGRMSSAVQSAVNAAAGQRGNAYSGGVSTGSMISAGVAAGIQSGRSGVVNAAASVISSAISAARSAAKINSPSKEGEEIGKYIDLGVSGGIESNTKKVQKTARVFSESIIDAMNDELDIHSPSKKSEKIAEEVTAGIDKGLKKGAKKTAEAAYKYANTIQSAIANGSESKKQKKAYNSAIKQDENYWKNKANKAKNNKNRKKYLAYAYLSAQNKADTEGKTTAEEEEEKRLEEARKKIDDLNNSIAKKKAAYENTFYELNGGRELSEIQKVEVATKSLADAQEVLNQVNANADATDEQRTEAYNNYIDALKNATSAQDAYNDSLLKQPGIVKSISEAETLIENNGADLSLSQERVILESYLGQIIEANNALKASGNYTQEQYLTMLQQEASARQALYQLARKENQAIIEMAEVERHRSEVNMEYIQKEGLSKEQQLDLVKKEGETLKDSLNILYNKENTYDEIISLTEKINQNLQEQKDLEAEITSERISRLQEQIDKEETILEYNQKSELTNEQRLENVKYEGFVLKNLLEELEKEGKSEEVILQVKKQIIANRKEQKSLEEQITSEYEEQYEKILETKNLIIDIEEARARIARKGAGLTLEDERTYAQKRLKDILRLEEDLLDSNNYSEEQLLKYLQEEADLREELYQIEEKINNERIESVDDEIDAEVTLLEFIQGKGLNAKQKLLINAQKLNKAQETYKQLIKSGTYTEDQRLKAIKNINSALSDYKDTLDAINQTSLDIKNPFSGADWNLKSVMENMKSQMTGIETWMEERQKAIDRGLSQKALDYLDNLSREDSVNLFASLNDATFEEFEAFNKTLEDYSKLTLEADEQYLSTTESMASDIKTISNNLYTLINGRNLSNTYTVGSLSSGLTSAGLVSSEISAQNDILKTLFNNVVASMDGVKQALNSFSEDYRTSTENLPSDLANALDNLKVAIDGRDFGRIIRKYA